MRRLQKRYLGMAILFLICVLGTVTACGASSAQDSPPTSSGWPITIATNHAQYAGSDEIDLTVTNHATYAIYALDTQASCSILSLQVLVQGQWQDSSAAPCAMLRVAAPVKIDAGGSYTARIRASLLSKSAESFPAGVYRLALTYFPGPDSRSGATTTYSAQLTVTGTSSGTGGSSTAPSGPPVQGTPMANP